MFQFLTSFSGGHGSQMKSNITKVVMLLQYGIGSNRHIAIPRQIRYDTVACSRKPEYLNQRDRPLLDNDHDNTKYAALSRWQV
jgi:hypothetical protein